MTSYKILYLPKNKIREFTHHEQTPTGVHVFINPVIKVTVIKVIKDFGFSKYPSTIK